MEEGVEKLNLPARTQIISAIEITLAVVFTVFALFGNTLIILAFCKHKTLRTIPNLLVLNLSIVDILAALTGHPLLVAVLIRGAWFLGPNVCKYQAILTSSLFMTSHLSITLITLNRYFIIVHYKKHPVVFAKRSTCTFILATWVLSFGFVLSLSLMAKENFRFHAKEALCIIARETAWRALLMVAFGNITFLATISFNAAIFKSVYLHRRKISFKLEAHLLERQEEGSRCSRRRRNRISIRKEEVYVTKKLFIVTSLYALCWLPQGILKNAGLLGSLDFPREIWMISTFSLQLTSLFNPLLYGLLNRKLRKVVLYMLRIKPNKRDVLSFPVTATNVRDRTRTVVTAQITSKNPFTVKGYVLKSIRSNEEKCYKEC